MNNQEAFQTGIASASGALTLTFQPPNTVQWLGRQVSTEITTVAPSGAVCNLRKNDKLISPVIPDMDAIGGEPPVMLRPSDRMTVEWTGLTAGQVGRATLFYDEVGWGE